MAHFVFAIVVVIVGAILWAAAPVLTLVVLAWLIFAIGGYVIGQPKDRGAVGILLGSFLGPIGLLVVAVIAPSDVRRSERERATGGTLAAAVLSRASDGTSRSCPWCAETIKTAAIICRHCGRDIQTASPTMS